MRPYQFALLRYVHDTVGGEFANIGVVMLDVEHRRLLLRVSARYGRLSKFFREIDGARYRSMVGQVERQLRAIEALLLQPNHLTPAPEDLESAMHRIFGERDGSFEVSSVMYGVDENPEDRLEELFRDFVLKYEAIDSRVHRDEDAIGRDFDARILVRPVVQQVRFDHTVRSSTYEYTFHTAWQNGTTQVLEPISFDLAEARTIVDKGNIWTGRLVNLMSGTDFRMTALVAPPSDPTLERAMDRAVAMLRSVPIVRDVVLERDADVAIRLIEHDLAH